MATMHGFTIRVNGQDGKPTTVLFSSVRKTPAMLGILKDINAKQREYDRLTVKRGMLRSRLQTLCQGDAGESDVDQYASDASYEQLQKRVDVAMTEIEKNDDEIDAINAALCDLMWQFYNKGFLGAGYTEELADQYAALLDPADFPMLRDRAMTGCGAVDFTKRDTP